MSPLGRLLASDEQLRRRAADAYEDHRLLGMVLQESDAGFTPQNRYPIPAQHSLRRFLRVLMRAAA